MKIYSVGGAVRDELLGLPVKDRDYVVVGSSPEEMERLGFRPVGKDFPVFLHPETQEEYALARTERKTAKGYKGFEIYTSPEVTLAEDLARRDLTINAMAKDDHGQIIDPFGGIADLEAGILRHISPAFNEDPVRVLRVARFAARFGFAVAPETLSLMREMVHNGEVEALVAERVWQELARGLLEEKPSKMIHCLKECGALSRIFPEIDVLFGVPQSPQHHPEIDTGVHVMLVLDHAASRGFPLEVRFAALLHDIGKGTTPPEKWPHHPGHEARGVELARDLCARLRVPNESRDLAILVAHSHGIAHRALELDAEGIFSLLQASDAFRKPDRFDSFLLGCISDFRGRPGYGEAPYPQADRLRAALRAALSVDAGSIAKTAQGGNEIREKVALARIGAIRAALS
ncbi:MAG: multifunctional CCA addition/repair protein [Burkholderiales bacterium]|nr:multifunctional CCA addition/repair protein [Burkholderiales bacterium]